MSFASAAAEDTTNEEPSSTADVSQSDPEGDAEEAAELQEVTVTGTRVETKTINQPADVRVVQEERLKRPGTKSAPQALSDVSGVKMNPRQEAATFTDLEVRGLSSNTTSGGNVLILLDGIPQRRLSFGGPYMGALPYDAISRMELVKGPMSSVYGRNALVGALQLFSDPGSPNQEFDVSLSYEYPTHTAHTGLKTSGPIGGTPTDGTRVSTYSLTGSFTWAEGWQPRNQAVKGDIYLHVDWHLTDKDTLTFLGGYFNTDEECVAPVFINKNGTLLPGFERDTNLAVPGQNSLGLQEYRLAVRYTRKWMKQIKTKATVSYWHGDTFWEVGRPGDAPGGTNTVVSRSASDRTFTENALFTELEMIASYDATSWLKGSLNLGASYEYATYDMKMVQITTEDALGQTGKYSSGLPIDWMTGEEPPRSTWRYSDETRRDTWEHDAGVFLRKQFAFMDRFFLHGGLRFDWFDRTQNIPATGDEAGQDGWALSPTVGLNVAILKMQNYKLNVYGNWGRGFSPIFRAVSNTEFADVEPEKSESFDVGVKTRLLGRMIEGSVVFFHLKRKDVVAYDASAEEWQNAGIWRVRGIETDWRYRPLKELELFAGYTWRQPVILESPTNPGVEGNRIPTISDHTFAGGLNWEVALGFGGGTEVRYVSGFYGNDANSFHLPEYVLWDAWVYYKWQDNLRVSLFIKNMLDSEYFSAVFGGVKNGSAFEGTPRSYGVSVEGHF